MITAKPTAREAVSARTLERATLVVMATGVALMLQPWWPDGMRVGFFVTLAGTLAQIIMGHVAGRAR